MKTIYVTAEAEGVGMGNAGHDDTRSINDLNWLPLRDTTKKSSIHTARQDGIEMF